ncbi:BrnA antitoxin family protein [Photobacterium aquimaris]|uniref:Antitoxin n=1 Tax=Photobacterium aquimaris TaxID=512643 RepID=A0A2T3HSZ5_9GAMM|nr:BrnA antitoxin family protein [Photobacterium aquimaris]OBU18113.1 antitoxin [Photobacterium aquimaris]PQJ36645.1 antitoxin [Photobacterium aquimaris]PST97707.1 antitoxin [Photobacterium aquimaris]
MRDQYDFSNSMANPYAKKVKKQITIRLDDDVVTYFKDLSEKNGIPYQNLINLYLKDCALKNKELTMDWQ